MSEKKNELDNLEEDMEVSEELDEVTEVAEVAENTSEEVAGEGEIFKKNKEIEALNQQVTAEKDKYLRVVAEYDNFRKRSLKDKQDAITNAQGNVVVEFLSVIDNFERALASDTEDENYKKGVQMIFNQYCDILKKVGVVEIESLNQPFDPNFHNAVTQMSDENFGENIVCQVFQKGYMLDGKVIRHAIVAVANP